METQWYKYSLEGNMKNKALTHWFVMEHKNVKAFAAEIQIHHRDTSIETQNKLKKKKKKEQYAQAKVLSSTYSGSIYSFKAFIR